MPSAPQLTADGGAGLDIAAASPACQHKFHWRFLASNSPYARPAK
jgi:hypothetical protein